MSASKKSRFGNLPVRTTSPKQDALKAVDEQVRESFSSQCRPDFKHALKQASARENRKVYQLLEDSLEDYLKRHHPDLLK